MELLIKEIFKNKEAAALPGLLESGGLPARLRAVRRAQGEPHLAREQHVPAAAPYLPGSLRAALAYPAAENAYDDAELRRVLEIRC